jgi:hypothetical protein
MENHLPIYRTMVRPFSLQLPIDESYGFAWRPSIMNSNPAHDFLEWFKERKVEHDLEIAAISVRAPARISAAA